LKILAATFALAATTLAAQSYVPNRVYDSAHKRFADFESMLADVANSDVVFVGEQHDDPNTHRLELAVLEGLLRRRQNLIVAFEMFERDVQEALDRFGAGRVSEEEFLKASRPWPRYATDYKPLIDFAVTHDLPIVASNVPRPIASDVSRTGLDDVVTGLADAPGFPHPEARAVAATCGGVRVHSVYVPNGRTPGSDHYEYKLAWLSALRHVVAGGPEAAVVCGDMNIAPTDADVFDPHAYIGQTHVTPPEREALAQLQALGLRDVVRDRWPTERVFTYWDYRAGMFHQDLGMRIDLILASDPVANRVQAAWVDRHARKGKGPSDHAPVIIDLDEAPDGDIGPVVPPPSNPVTKRGAKKLPQS